MTAEKGIISRLDQIYDLYLINSFVSKSKGIIEKVLKTGYMVPPLIVNFKWPEKGGAHQKILFYPFVPKTNLKKRVLSPTARRTNYKMFNYVGFDELPHFVLYNSGKRA